LVRQALLRGIPSGALNLVVVVVQSGDVGAGELCNLSSRATNTAANVKDFVSILDANLGS
jgi:hypothetical protein